MNRHQINTAVCSLEKDCLTQSRDKRPEIERSAAVFHVVAAAAATSAAGAATAVTVVRRSYRFTRALVSNNGDGIFVHAGQVGTDYLTKTEENY